MSMYSVHTSTAILGYTAEPTYCYKPPSGAPQVIGRKERARGEVATGVIYEGTIYNLPGRNDFEGCETAAVVEIDAGTVLNEQKRRIAAAEAAEAALEDAMCEEDMAAEQRIAEIENALCELDERSA